MRLLKIAGLMVWFGFSQGLLAMQQERVRNEEAQEWSLQDARWVYSELKKDYKQCRQLSFHNNSSLKGLLSSCWNVVDLTATPGLFVGVHLIKCMGAIALMKAMHALTGVPETEESQCIELLIAAAYPLSETVYTTWSNRNREI